MDPRAGVLGDRRPRKFFASVRERLVAFAAHQFRLARPQPDGQSERAHLEAAAERGDRAAQAALAGPEFPEGAEYIWGWFKALDAGRGSSGFGVSPISWAELDAFARLRGVQMSGREIDWLRALDRACLAAVAEGTKK